MLRVPERRQQQLPGPRARCNLRDAILRMCVCMPNTCLRAVYARDWMCLKSDGHKQAEQMFSELFNPDAAPFLSPGNRNSFFGSRRVHVINGLYYYFYYYHHFFSFSIIIVVRPSGSEHGFRRRTTTNPLGVVFVCC